MARPPTRRASSELYLTGSLPSINPTQSNRASGGGRLPRLRGFPGYTVTVDMPASATATPSMWSTKRMTLKC